MWSKRVVTFASRLVAKNRQFHCDAKKYEKFENPFLRAFRILRDDLTFKNRPKPFPFQPTGGYAIEKQFPKHADILIIGGGGMGSSIAYWIKEKTGLEGVNVVVVEKDMTFQKSSTALSVGGLRQQFSLKENIEMSLFGAEFMRTIKKRFGPDADVFFTPHGYLMLASEYSAQHLIDLSKFQKELGAVNEILGKEALKARFPWMDVTDVEVGCLGLEKEGWFDPWALLSLMKRAAVSMGTQYVNGQVIGFEYESRDDIYIQGVEPGEYNALKWVLVKLPSGEVRRIEFAYCVIAAGADSGEIAKLARIGVGEGLLSIPLPVEKRKRYVYRFDCQGEPPGINTPLVIDTTGAYFRRDGLGGCFIGGMSPPPEEEPAADDLDYVDYDYFNEKVWPKLAKRVPAFEAIKGNIKDYYFFNDHFWPKLINRVPVFDDIKVRSAWSGYYEYNTYDENGIIGVHPYYYNLLFATGFSGHGIQQAPAVGRAIAELIIDGQFQTIGLERLSFDRLIVDKPMYEVGII